LGETLAEVGYRDNLTRVYYGLVAPAAVPKSIVHRVRNAIADIMSMPVFRQRNLIDRALEPIANTPEEFARFLMRDRLISEQVVKEAGLQPQ
jgi:tripartite-type tricarboxylate transporter receptor subunit TctC